jgi:lycopene beta-cyclase
MTDGRLFIEETSLAHRPAVSVDLLRARLLARLEALGLQQAARLGQEHCAIAMGLGLPAHGQSLVPFGAAAAMVHPSSGYSIAHVLRKAEPVARAIVEALDTDGPELAVAAGNATLWPRAHRALWELYALGLETLVNMNAAETTGFFHAFFGLPQRDWAGFLSGTLRPGELTSVMTRLFRNLPASVRWHLLRTSVSTGAAPLARTFLQPGSP